METRSGCLDCGMPIKSPVDSFYCDDCTVTVDDEPTVKKNYIDRCDHCGTKCANCVEMDRVKDPGFDDVRNPKHYCRDGAIEFIEYANSNLTVDEFKGAMKFNVGKYLDRSPYKGSELEDLGKARFYLDALIEVLEGKDPF